MSFRKERKFRLTASDARKLKGQLLAKGMRPLHPDRKITSQYFDNGDNQAFSDSEEGILPRYKIRVRWYNDDQSKLALERKTSSIEGRFKTTQVLGILEFERMLSSGGFDRAYGKIFAGAKISYQRSYFEYQGIRITFDTNIRYKFSGTQRQHRDLEEVVEIKAPYEMSDDVLERLLPIPSSRFSKYARAFLHRANAI